MGFSPGWNAAGPRSDGAAVVIVSTLAIGSIVTGTATSVTSFIDAPRPKSSATKFSLSCCTASADGKGMSVRERSARRTFRDASPMKRPKLCKSFPSNAATAFASSVMMSAPFAQTRPSTKLMLPMCSTASKSASCASPCKHCFPILASNVKMRRTLAPTSTTRIATAASVMKAPGFAASGAGSKPPGDAPAALPLGWTIPRIVFIAIWQASDNSSESAPVLWARQWRSRPEISEPLKKASVRPLTKSAGCCVSSDATKVVSGVGNQGLPRVCSPRVESTSAERSRWQAVEAMAIRDGPPGSATPPQNGACS
mmetsp:Transcript_115757/g.327362  ORF Transcript_115757/g.327362 Transcript_115757/m.327362 type:complete len:312 (-) Transcript_115757:35-970(-)